MGGRIGHDPFAITRPRAASAVVMLIIASGVVCVRRDLSEFRLQEVVAAEFPASAAFVGEHKYTGPLYNHFDWGGYLLWRLPRVPVIVDGRGNVHGDKRVIDIHETWIGKQKWSSDPDLAASRLIIAGIEFPLASLLRMDSRFELVYEDKIAVVFIARSQSADHETIKGQPQQN